MEGGAYNPFDAWINDNDNDNDDDDYNDHRPIGLKSMDDALLNETLAQASPYIMSSGNETSDDWFMDEDGELFGTPLNTMNDSSQQEDRLQKMYGSESSMIGVGGDGLYPGSSMMLPREDDSKPYKKTITFADTIATPLGAFQASETSLGGTLDVFGEGTGKESNEEDFEDMDDESFASTVDSVDEEEKAIKRKLLYAVGGVGFFALFGMAMKHILKLFDKASNDNDLDGGMDVTNATDQLSNVNDLATALGGDGGSSNAALAAQGTADVANASFNASASASQSQLGVGLASGGQNAAALSGPQTQVLQTMAVNAASNAASSAATASSAIASTAAAAAGAAAATTATVTTVAAVTAVVGIAGIATYSSTSGFARMSQPAVFSSPLVCSDNAMESLARMKISFLTDVLPPKDKLEKMFVDAYNLVSPKCDELFQRVSLDARLEDSSIGKLGIETSWTAVVSCFPACPLEPLFGTELREEERQLETRDLQESTKIPLSMFEFLEALNIESMLQFGVGFQVAFGETFFAGSSSSINVDQSDGIYSDFELAFAESFQSVYLVDMPEEPSTSPSLVPTISAGPSSEPSHLPTKSSSPSSVPSESPSPPAESSFGPSESSHPSQVPSATSSSTPSTTPSTGPTLSLSTDPTVSPSSLPSTSPPSVLPSASPTTSSPTFRPSASPTTLSPTLSPSISMPPSVYGATESPTDFPSESPSDSPSDSPSEFPSESPSDQPSDAPSDPPSESPSESPSDSPSDSPSALPSKMPSALPSENPSYVGSAPPTLSAIPTNDPSGDPSEFPSSSPSDKPSTVPSQAPSAGPSSPPSGKPSTEESLSPTESSNPSSLPSRQPSAVPSALPSEKPSYEGSAPPTSSADPSVQPSKQPSQVPSSKPSVTESGRPSSSPSSKPSVEPSSSPSDAPTKKVTSEPSVQPSSLPSGKPSSIPSKEPSGTPSKDPTSKPSKEPSKAPTGTPSTAPSKSPTGVPSKDPSAAPSKSPTAFPSEDPSAAPSASPSFGTTGQCPSSKCLDENSNKFVDFTCNTEKDPNGVQECAQRNNALGLNESCGCCSGTYTTHTACKESNNFIDCCA